MISSILLSTEDSCNKNNVIIIETYKSTPEIYNKMSMYQKIIKEHYILGNHNNQRINELKSELIELIKENVKYNWEKLVSLAMECFGNPEKFWKKLELLRGTNREVNKYLIIENENWDSSDSENYGDTETEIITDHAEQVNTMSTVWENVFQENESEEYENNANINSVNNWYNTHENLFIQREYIDYNLLKEDHPILRPIEMNELNNAIKATRDKAPGPTGIRIKQIKYLPRNCKEIMLNIYNAITVTKFYPTPLEKMYMIFIKKPNKDGSNPLNYRGLVLMELLVKIYDRIISLEWNYFLFASYQLTDKTIILMK